MSIRKRVWRAKGNDGQPVMREAWVVDYRDGAGERRHKSFRLKKDAENWSTTALFEVKQGIHTPDSTSPTIAEAADEWLKECERGDGDREPLERSTIRQYQNHVDLHIKPYIGGKKLSKLTAPGVKEFLGQLRKDGRSPSMVRKVRASLAAIINAARDHGLVAQNVVLGSRKRRQSTRNVRKLELGVDIPSTNEIRTLVHAAKGRFRPFLITAVFTGMRASELRGLPWSAVDFDAKVVHIRQRADEWGTIGSPKSKAGRREIMMTPLVSNTLKEWKLACPRRGVVKDKDGNVTEPGELWLVFPNGIGKVETHANLWNRNFAPLQIEGGLSVDTGEVDKDDKPIIKAKYGFHALRHFYASWLIDQRFQPKRIQETLGHSSITMTFDLYGHLFEIDEEETNGLAQSEAALLA